MQAWILLVQLFLIRISTGISVQCSPPKCMQLDKLLSEHKLPLHRAVPTSEDSHRYCYMGSDPYTPLALLHVWDAVVISIATEQAPLPLVQLFRVENDTLDTAHGSGHLVLSPIGVSCVEVRGTDHTPSSEGLEYTLMVTTTLPLYYPGLLVIGLILFFVAPSLSRNIGVYYSTSVLLGVVMSLLLLLFIFYRMVPKSSVFGWGVLFGGYSVVISVLYYGMLHMMELLWEYWLYLVGYGVISGLVTFAVVYRLGAPDPRTMNLLQWGAQLVAVVMIYSSFHQLYWVALTGIGLVLISSIFVNFICRIWDALCAPICCCLAPVIRCLSFFNPFKQRYPKRRLLTMEEYDAMGEVETKRALENLRKHCKSSLKNEEIWGTVSKLQDPKRFTEFLSGMPHITSEERAEHEFSFIVEESTDDESETTNSSVPSPNPSPLKNTTTAQPPFRRDIHATRT